MRRGGRFGAGCRSGKDSDVADARIGLTDAVNVVLAGVYHTTRIATLDRRHYPVLRLLDGNPVEIVPSYGCRASRMQRLDRDAPGAADMSMRVSNVTS